MSFDILSNRSSFTEFTTLLLVCGHLLAPPCGLGEGIVVDTVIASVDGKPITLHDLSLRVSKPLSMEELAQDGEARAALDAMILDKILQEESKQRGLDVQEGEVDQYIAEVAKRNNLSREDFLTALVQNGTTETSYREQVKLEILKSKVTAASLRGGVAITDSEVEKYIEEHEDALAKGTLLTLSQIVLTKDKHEKKAAVQLLKNIITQIDDGEEFAVLAEKYSEGPEAKEGGKLGELAEKDLSPAIFDAVFPLETGEVSEIVSSPVGYHIFQLQDRNDDEDDILERVKKQVRNKLEREKLELKIATFISEDLMKAHAVDKKI